MKTYSETEWNDLSIRTRHRIERDTLDRTLDQAGMQAAHEIASDDPGVAEQLRRATQL